MHEVWPFWPMRREIAVSRYKVAITSQNKSADIEITHEENKLVAVRRALPNHVLKRPPAWAFSEEVIRFMQGHGVAVIKVICDNILYTCNMSKFLALAVPFNRGFGPQRFLPLQYWEKKYLGEKESCRQI